MKKFEDMKISELRELTKQFKEQNPKIQTAQELLDELEDERRIIKKHWKKVNSIK